MATNNTQFPKQVDEKLKIVIELANYWGKSLSYQSHDWSGIKELVKQFSSFATEYLALLDKMPPSIANRHFILNEGVEKLLNGFNILSRACEQRRGQMTDKSLSNYLVIAEDVLKKYCGLWKPTLSEQNGPYVKLKTPVAYFEKLYQITRAIYAVDIPIVSIPLTEYKNPDKWQALAHEMGHHIYWNSLERLNDVAALHERMYAELGMLSLSSTNPWDRWVEEVFADVCGGIFAGLDYLISSRDFMVGRSKTLADLGANDDEHPCPYLRPLIVAATIRKVYPSLALEANKIETDWRAYCAGADKLQLKKKPNTSLGILVNEVDRVVDMILTAKVWPANNAQASYIQLKDLFDTSQPPAQSLDAGWLASMPINSQPLKTTPVGVGQIPTPMKDLWQYLAEKMDPDGTLEENEKNLAQWRLLLDLGLDDSHGFHRHFHAMPERHWYYLWWHTHSADTWTLIPD